VIFHKDSFKAHLRPVLPPGIRNWHLIDIFD
jgi:hypothetical protein